MSPLSDLPARQRALHDHQSTLLVEAGAGTGKTTLLAGRIALLLASGIAPRGIAAITFTEKAAAELKDRVLRYATMLAQGLVPADLSELLARPLGPPQLAQLNAATGALGELTVVTIHAFCQQLVRPYPVEAVVDPGASILDANHAALARSALLGSFLQAALEQPAQYPALTALFEHSPHSALGTLTTMADARLAHREARLAAPPNLVGTAAAFQAQVADFSAWFAQLEAQGLAEPETAKLVVGWRAAAAHYHARLMTPAAGPSLVPLASHLAAGLPLTKERSVRAWQNLGKWQAVAQRALGGSRAAANDYGRELSAAGQQHHQQTGEHWQALQQSLSAHAAHALLQELDPLLVRYANYKQSRALLDFEDLLITARTLLKTQPAVRQALAGRYPRVLVDEFQDTDPLQVEILWLLCGDGDPDASWEQQCLRPGALFCVGDPKQAIYRFRGADINTYHAARAAIGRAPAGQSLLIATNFRAAEPIIRWVNEMFEKPLSALGQPGFTGLVAHPGAALFAPHRHNPCVRSFVLKPTAAQNIGSSADAPQAGLRDEEASIVGQHCATLLSHGLFADQPQQRPLAPRDIALITQTGTELWRYERALEAHGIPFASQAGKGFFFRQEVHDLIAVTRILADAQDTVALGAFLRGPCVGLTDEQLLDLDAALRRVDGPARAPRLTLWTPVGEIAQPVAREVLTTLQLLARSARQTTPYLLLAHAVEALQIRAILRARQPQNPARALGNIDRFLELARPWAGRGLRGFAHYLRARWEAGEAEVEARSDLHENAVQLITAHSAKGLEWPVVFVINSFTLAQHTPDPVLLQRETAALVTNFGALACAEYVALNALEKAELEREKIRLLYVACTRAKHLLVLPALPPHLKSWMRNAGVEVAENSPLGRLSNPPTPSLPVRAAVTFPAISNAPANLQDSASFAREADAIALATPQLRWQRPSAHDLSHWVPAAPLPDADEDEPAPSHVVGGSERGNTLHLLMEEILCGLLAQDPAALRARALQLIAVADVGQPLDPDELTGVLLRTLALPIVARARPRLQAEFTTFAAQIDKREEILTRGIADAVEVDERGQITAVFDWKSDVAPSLDIKAQYQTQVRAYLLATGAAHGYVVYMTLGLVETVTP